jgi:uncharacterized protein (DUF2235 family)
MAKRIIVLSDGTGNSAAQIWRTNVWRTFEALDLTGSDQVAFYDDGVGTSSFKPAAILGGAFGYGLKRNVIGIYKFVCRNFRSREDYARAYIGSNALEEDFRDDEIYGFGFSRGAFTIRVVIGLILDQGILRAQTEAELDALAIEAYRNYRARHFETRTAIERPFRAIRDWFLRQRRSDRLDNVYNGVKIRFLGLWDTVAAYGLPVDEMTRGVSRYLWPLELPNRKLDPARVERACHALSLDDQRTTFHPILWDESLFPPPDPRPQPFLTSNEKLTQIWFAGVHSNVGGGYPDDSLAYIPLYWIWKEAKDCGLCFKASPHADPDAFLSAQSKEDKDGRLYDSRSGLAGYYRYGPRSIDDLCNSTTGDPRDEVTIARPKIHETVFKRLAAGAHCYAPIGLPKVYDVVAYNPTSQNHEIIDDPTRLPEDPNAAIIRQKQQEEIVWSSVWRGRGLYFLTVLASLYLAIYPLAITIPATAELTTRLRFLSDTIRLVSIPLPSATNRWIDAYARDPALFLIAALTVGILIWLNAGLKGRITDQMRRLLALSIRQPNNLPASSTIIANWRPGGLLEFSAVALMIVAVIFGLVINPFFATPSWLWAPLRSFLAKLSPWTGLVAAVSLAVVFTPSTSVYALRSSPTYQKALRELRLRYAPIFFAVAFCGLGILFASHYASNIVDSFGGFCQKTTIKGNAMNADTGGIAHICYETEIKKCPIDTRAIDPKTSPCQLNTDGPVKCTGKVFLMDTRDLCPSTGVFVETDNRYHLFVEEYQPMTTTPYAPDDLKWRFAGIDSDPGGKTISALGTYDDGSCGALDDWRRRLGVAGAPLRTVCNYGAALGRQIFGIVAYPLKRSFDRQLGVFTLRYGTTGNEENFIDPDVPPAKGGKLDETFKPTRDGELFAYLNKPTFPVWPNVAHKLNSGIAKVTIIRIPRKN